MEAQIRDSSTTYSNALVSRSGNGNERPQQGDSDPDLEMMRDILERLASRDDIPEELWISAGLNPSLARNLDLFSLSGLRREDRERL